MAAANLQDRILRFEPGVRLLVEIGLVVAIALICARLVWLAVAPQPAVAAYKERPLPTMMVGEAQRVEADLSLLVRSNPFEGAGVAAEVVEDAPETQLNLRMIGGFSATNGRAGSAYIIMPNNQQQRFVEGDEVLPGVVLKRVLSDRLILTRNGADEILFENDRSRGLSVIGDGSTPGEPRDVAPAPVSTRIDDPDVLLRLVALSEARSNGSVIGYRLEARSDLEGFQALGFQPGDVLIRVNGQAVGDIDIAEMVDAMGAYQEALLEIDRGGNAVQIILEFDE